MPKQIQAGWNDRRRFARDPPQLRRNECIPGAVGADLEAVLLAVHPHMNDAGCTLRVALQAISVHAEMGKLIGIALAGGVGADARHHQRRGAQRGQISCQIEWRAADDSTIGKQVQQRFAQHHHGGQVAHAAVSRTKAKALQFDPSLI